MRRVRSVTTGVFPDIDGCVVIVVVGVNCIGAVAVKRQLVTGVS